MGLVGVVAIASLLLRIFPDLQTVFFLVPGHTTTRPWQVLSAGYFEDSFLNLLLGSAALLGCGWRLSFQPSTARSSLSTAAAAPPLPCR